MIIFDKNKVINIIIEYDNEVQNGGHWHFFHNNAEGMDFELISRLFASYLPKIIYENYCSALAIWKSIDNLHLTASTSMFESIDNIYYKKEFGAKLQKVIDKLTLDSQSLKSLKYTSVSNVVDMYRCAAIEEHNYLYVNFNMAKSRCARKTVDKIIKKCKTNDELKKAILATLFDDNDFVRLSTAANCLFGKFCDEAQPLAILDEILSKNPSNLLGLAVENVIKLYKTGKII